MRYLTKQIKNILKTYYFKPNCIRIIILGPYRGIKFTIPPARDRLSIFYKSYEPDITVYLKKIIKPGMTIFDIGAHYGIHSLYAWKLMGKTGTVFAFEPYGKNYNLLTSNIKNNKADNIFAIKAAVSDYTGKGVMKEGKKTGDHRLIKKGGQNLVKVVRLDDFCEKKLEQPHLVKIDVEGKESQVLKGGEHTIRKYLPNLLIEHHNKQKEIFEILSRYNYSEIIEQERHIIVLNTGLS